ncbi:hypothetical protein PPGU16_70050 (plasmid) [Paraburkholderia largidicola]|uniref:Branched-chain amino acid ABC transporter permease n=1 Tax=Paraburkholderia largidicola TaxID=3014751 RepID=A0A7I8C0H5_9BURK|nr:hypothetical protein PPGU16_70050 [Paraburkholderia sp. PGU16]
MRSAVKKKNLIGALLGLVALAIFPVLSGNPYYIHLVETIMIYAILLFGLDIVVGYTGRSRWDTRGCSASARTRRACCSSSSACRST